MGQRVVLGHTATRFCRSPSPSGRSPCDPASEQGVPGQPGQAHGSEVRPMVAPGQPTASERFTRKIGAAVGITD